MLINAKQFFIELWNADIEFRYLLLGALVASAIQTAIEIIGDYFESHKDRHN